MENKKILVTGGSSGVGRLLVAKLSKNNMVVTMARRIERLHSLFDANTNVAIYKADLSNLEELENVLNEIDKDCDGFDCIVNCAGVMVSGKVDELRIDEFENSLNVNSISPLLIVKHYLPFMKANNYGRIVNFTSGAPLNCFPGFAAYSASKSFLNAWTLTLGKEVADYDIKINLMSPGPVRTEMAPDATLSPDICLPTFNYLLDDVESSGGFYWLGYKVPLSPDLEGIDWLHGIGNNKIEKVL